MNKKLEHIIFILLIIKHNGKCYESLMDMQNKFKYQLYYPHCSTLCNLRILTDDLRNGGCTIELAFEYAEKYIALQDPIDIFEAKLMRW